MSRWNSRGRARSPNAPAAFIAPCLPTLAHKAPSASGWAHEIKHDGYRLQIHVRNGRARLYTMTGVDWTARFPAIAEAAAKIKGHAIIDAEAVRCGPDGIANFEALYRRENDAAVIAYAFDLLACDGDDLRAQPWIERRMQLAKMLRRSKGALVLSEHVEGDGPTIFEHACRMGLEGIVSKRTDAPYRSGKSRQWLKIKNPKAPAVLRITS